MNRLKTKSTRPLLFKCILIAAGLISSMATLAQAGNMGIGTALPGSKLTINGSFGATYKNIDANVTLDGTDFYYAINSSAARTVTLPAATAASPAAGNILGRTYHIKNTGSFNDRPVKPVKFNMLGISAAAIRNHAVVNNGNFIQLDLLLQTEEYRNTISIAVIYCI